MEKERLIVLCVDRDNDIGEKLQIQGPVMGKEKILKVATNLSVKDPEESDANALFGSVKLFDELKEKYDAELAVITGHRSRGVESDREIVRQLGKVLAKRPSDFVILVSDGKDDEYVIPIIQSKIPILSVKRIIVKQSEQLESGYYKIKDFLHETMENPKFARMVFGLPAIALLLYALFGYEGWRLILGIVGAYLFIKGFKLEDYVMSVFEELKNSFTKRRFAFFVYVVSFTILGLALYRGYMSITEFASVGLFEGISAFMIASIYFFWIAGTIAWLGNNISLGTKSSSRMASVPIFGLAVAIVVYNVSDMILNPEISSFNFIISIALGFVIAFIALSLEAVD
ncbi:MAG: DUF373 family protein [Candidatus Aenigmarchaeota archaeon]|nr:DUF373 family protein [Candidatus Aenigmarchaeota archaeon]